jgi:hypothetical protein
MPPCQCGHTGSDHKWKVRRMRGWCLPSSRCDCTKYRPEKPDIVKCRIPGCHDEKHEHDATRGSANPLVGELRYKRHGRSP